MLYIGGVIQYSYPAPLSKEQWPKTKEKATNATIEYFNKEKNVDVVITDINFSGEFAKCEIYFEGHVTNHEQQKISATVDCSDNYKIKLILIGEKQN